MSKLSVFSFVMLAMVFLVSCEDEVDPVDDDNASGTPASGGLWDNLSSGSGAYVDMDDFVDMTVTTSDVNVSTGEISGLDFTDVLIRPEDNDYLLKVRFFELSDEGGHNYPEAGMYNFDFAKVESNDQAMIIADITWFEPNYGFIFAVNEFTRASFDLVYINGEDIDVAFDIVFVSDDNAETITTKGVARAR